MESGKACKRASSCLVAKALEEEMDPKARLTKKNKEVEDGGRSFFDCHICMDMAREPIVTCCGHLFCWSCFCMLPYSSTTAKAKECPVCRGEVKDSALTPIYGNGNSKLDSGYGMVMIPPRPQAQRVKSVRQNRPLLVEILQEQRQHVFAERTSPPSIESFHSDRRASTTRTFPPLIGGFLIFDGMDVHWDLEF